MSKLYVPHHEKRLWWFFKTYWYGNGSGSDEPAHVLSYKALWCLWNYFSVSYNGGSYMSGHFIWNLWKNQPLVSFINFIWNDHECKILFFIHVWLLNITLSRMVWCRYLPVTKCYVMCSHIIFMTCHYPLNWSDVGCAVRLETRRSRVQPLPRSATFFRGDWSWNIFYSHSLTSADSRKAVVSFWWKNVHNTG